MVERRPNDEFEFTVELHSEPSGVVPVEELVTPIACGSLLRGRYLIESLLGSGGCALVYKARDLNCDRPDAPDAFVAIKVLRTELRSQPGAVARLKREFYQTRMLTHPNIVRVFDLDYESGVCFTVMELLQGSTLSERLRDGPGLYGAEIRSILWSVGDALALAHARNIVHGDLKPANLYILQDGITAKLLDFGATPELGTAQIAEQFGAIPAVATPAFSSPQVLSGESPEVRDDVYSLACMARLLCDRQLVTADDPPVLSADWQRALIERGLSAERVDRPASVDALLEFLSPATTEPELPAPKTRGARRPVHWRKPLAIAAALAAVAVLTTVAVRTLRDQARARAAAAAYVAPPPQPVVVAEPAPPPVAVAPPPRAYAEVSFDVPEISVSARASSLAIPLRRERNRTESVKVRWRLKAEHPDGSAPLRGKSSGVVEIGEYQSLKTLFIPLPAADSGTLTGEFSVRLTAASPNAHIGRNHTVIVSVH